MVKLRLFTTVCRPDMILPAGGVYWVSRDLADQLLASRMVHGLDEKGKPKYGGPCAEIVADKSVKALKVTKPDPQDVPASEAVEDEDGEVIGG